MLQTSEVQQILFSGDTPLHHACREGHEDVAKLLLDHTADPNVANDQGRNHEGCISWMRGYEIPSDPQDFFYLTLM